MIECGNCGGQGKIAWFDGDVTTCNRCNGTGQVESATTNPSPGPTTTPVEKREEDVATDGYSVKLRLIATANSMHGDVVKCEHKLCSCEFDYEVDHLDENSALRAYCYALGRELKYAQIALAEPQPISNPLVCGRRQEAARELVQTWRGRGCTPELRAVYSLCADELAALLEEKS